MNPNLILKRLGKISQYPYFTKNSTDLKYFLGYTGSNGYLLVLGAEDFIFYTDARYIEAYQDKIGIKKVKLLENIYIHPLYTILNDFKRLDLKTLYIDFHYFTYQEALYLKEELDNIGVVLKKIDIPTSVQRMKKDSEELVYIKKSQEINEKAFIGAMSLLKEGISEMDITMEYEYLIKKQGAEGTSFNPIFVFGTNTSLPHGVPSNYQLKNGDIILFDGGALYNGYCSDMTRTFSFGEPKQKDFKTHYQILLNSQIQALEFIKEAKEYAEIDKYIRDFLQKNNLEQFFTHSTGHGVGIDIHEAPRIFHQQTGSIIEDGHVFTIEPGIYLAGKYGIRIEDMVYVKNKQNSQIEILSGLSKDLLIL